MPLSIIIAWLRELEASWAAIDDCVPPSSPLSAIALAQVPRIRGLVGIFITVVASVSSSWYLIISNEIVWASVGIGDKSTLRLLVASAPLNP